jgi:predicted Zn-dependent peptidase
VREERRLTYDASFTFKGSELQPGGWYLVSVTSSPSQVQAAVTACKESLDSLAGDAFSLADSVQSTKRTLRSRFLAESATNKFWIEQLSGTQLLEAPYKSVRCIAEYEKILAAVTVTDVVQLISLIALDDDNTMTSGVGVASPAPPASWAA